MKKQLGIAAAIPSLGIILIGVFLYMHDRTSAPAEEISKPATSSTTSMIITSPSFNHNESIPAKFTCEGGDINPALVVENVPESAKSLALIVDDPDAPSETFTPTPSPKNGKVWGFTHWTAWNINPLTKSIKEESIPPGSVEGATDFGRVGYGGPCPPPGKPHNYRFTLYALDAMLNLPEGSERTNLEKEIKKHIIAEAQLIGLYERK